MFAVAYFIADKLLKLLKSSPQIRAIVLTTLPNLVQAYFASLGDFYTWELSKKVFGKRSNTAWVTLMMSVLSPWQWFFSTRTFSNSLEMSLTIIALNFWPWELTSNPELHQNCRDTSEEISDIIDTCVMLDAKSIKKSRICLFLAGTACIIRPTNLLIWFSLTIPQVNVLLAKNPRLFIGKICPIFLGEGLKCLSLLLILSAISDRLYYHTWIFPPYNWLHFNIAQDLAIFYGANNWHFYFTQGLPQLLVTYLPFTLIGLCNALVMPPNDIRFILTVTVMVTVGSLSLISHKEVRFIYPILPLILIITAPIVTKFFTNSDPLARKNVRSNSQNRSLQHRFLLITSIVLNVIVAIYITTVHQSGVIAILPHLRKSYEVSYLTDDGSSLLPKPINNKTTPYVAFIMPCHSTPYRSALIHPNLKAWALTCSPPLHIPPYTVDRLNYRDEADRFYDNPVEFLQREVGRKGREWPLFVVGFEGIENVLRQVWESVDEKRGNKLKERKRIFNSHWHDDPRRKGDVILWELVRGSD
ncbi:GPI mannosyltransferase 3 [Golovinomyces cichoracearum]|uniref:Mannosyltransferase n=1 Tax=Golovinomyces cichoracearum TaxID=62708 RepID=A0A420J4V4_9PEZI|nr:GPI mannosyltransferase 3 [Golovinomyces cichoracearum]